MAASAAVNDSVVVFGDAVEDCTSNKPCGTNKTSAKVNALAMRIGPRYRTYLSYPTIIKKCFGSFDKGVGATLAISVVNLTKENLSAQSVADNN